MTKPDKSIPSAPDFIFVVVSREDVFAARLDDTIEVLGYLTTSPEALISYCQRVEIQFDGFSEHRAELWKIPAVRAFVHRLDETFPFWLYFLTHEGTGLLAVARCFLLPHLTEAADRATNGPRLAQLLERRWFPALNLMAARAGLNEVDLQRLSDGAVDYLMNSRRTQ